ncbi:S-layer homology domain-containing protein [Paenisporosarcina quisquiliarum]|uniref:CAP and S-layer homology domain-containing protein n=1 Tax=Paenisporosarcina quisquiliarum TaxID=365346 RepID=UPI003734F9E1
MKRIVMYLTTIIFIFSLSNSNASAETRFSDVPTSYWAHTSIDYVANLKIVNGYEDGTYRPKDPITRSQAAKLLASALKLDLSTLYSPKFQDVSKNHSAYNEIAKLTELGIFQNKTYFNPNEYLTRGQMSKIVSEGFNIVVDDINKHKFRDVSKDYWAYDYIHTIAEVKIASGVDQFHFDPTGYVTRAHMAAFIHGALEFKKIELRYQAVYDYVTSKYIFSENEFPSYSNKTIELINVERKNQGLMPLVMDKELSQVALIKANDLAENGYWEHYSPIYGPPWEMAANFDYSYKSFGENIARTYRTPEDVVVAWMDSEGHRANILKDNYTRVGVGVTKDNNGNFYWVHMFASK